MLNGKECEKYEKFLQMRAINLGDDFYQFIILISHPSKNSRLYQSGKCCGE